MNDDTIKYAVVNAEDKVKSFAIWHPSPESAQAEAVRLARQHSATFLVLKTIGYARPSVIEWVECKPKREDF